MGKFNKSKFGGNRDAGRSFGQRDAEKTMFRATCSECGASCEVPFKPSGDKPVYCRDCFQSKRTGDDRGRSSERRFDRNSFQDKKMFEAVCSDCGSTFQLPFRPHQDRPVFCSQCFEGKDKSSAGRNAQATVSSQPNAQLDMINAKLDRILKLLLPEANVLPAKKETIKEILIMPEPKRTPAKVSTKKGAKTEKKKVKKVAVKKGAKKKKK